MHLNRLCLVLPADSDEIYTFDPQKHIASPPPPPLPPPTPTEVIKKHHRRRHRNCGGRRVVSFLGDSFRRLRESKWIHLCHHHHHSHHDGGDSFRSGVFYDLEGIQMSEKVGGDNPRIFSYSELYIGSNGFDKNEILGSGGFGRVYKAVLPSDNTVVAVKCLTEKGEAFEKTFAAELVAVAHLRHRNLVRLRGWCVHEDQLLLVYDYMINRSLDTVLFRKPENLRSEPLSWGRRKNIVNGLASALFYLHENLETQIIHRDVKTSNVMLDSHYNARLGDFGLARWLEHDLEYPIRTPSMKDKQFRLVDTTRIGGTIGYLPPESFQRKGAATAKSDVFSFGIVVLEVASGRRAVDLTYPDEQIVLLDWVRKLSDEGNLLQVGDTRIPDGSFGLSDMERLIHIGLLCTLNNPESRPNMKWLVDALSGRIAGKLPPLPSFESYAQYISLSSTTNTSISNSNNNTTTTEEANSPTTPFPFPPPETTSNYVSATGETIYATAEVENNNSTASRFFRRQPTSKFMVETAREVTYKEIVTATNNFSDENKLAEVDFGTAYCGFLDNHRVVVKRLGNTKCPALITRYSNELQNLGKLRHRNLLQLRGWCTEQGEMLLVYDNAAKRRLSHLLFHHDNRIGYSVLQWHHRYNVIKSLASALLYLHEEWDQQVIHRNVTSFAVTLDPDSNVRLCSFALAEFLTRGGDRDHYHHHHAGTETTTSGSVHGIFGYMSPEYMESGEATTMVDVYSFGVVVLEVVTGMMAVDFRLPEVLLVKRVHGFEIRKRPLEELVDLKLDGKFNREELIRLVRLGIVCTRSNPELRPSMRQIMSILDGNDTCFTKKGQKKEKRAEWIDVNAYSLSLIRRIQALGIQ